MATRCVWAALVCVAALGGCSPYGSKVQEGDLEIYYKSPVDEATATRVLRFIRADGFQDGNRVSIQLRDEGGVYQYRMVVREGMASDPQAIALMKRAAAQLEQGPLAGKPVEVHMCDDRLNTLTVVRK